MILTHGAGSDRDAELLVALDRTLTERGHHIERINLAFRCARPNGPPSRGDQERDQACLREAADRLRKLHGGPVWIGGHSYGGRMASMLLAREPDAADGLLLMGYPLHPPKRVGDARTAHWPDLKCPVVFVSGSRDAFGSPEEFQRAFGQLPTPPRTRVIEGAGHDLKPSRRTADRIFDSVVTVIADLWVEVISGN